MNPEHMAKAHAMLEGAADGPIAVAELLATQLAEVERLTRELAAGYQLYERAQQSLLTAGTEHARDLRHLAARNAEVAGWTLHCANLESDVERAHELAGSYFAATNAQLSERRIIDVLEAVKRDRDERTRERDDALRRTEHLLGGLSWAEATAANPMDPETTEEPKP